MLSATGIVGAIVVLVLGAVLVLPADRASAPVGPAAGTASIYVVAQDGSGDFVTITEAVDAAADGDTIMVKPGVYIEAVTIAKDITRVGSRIVRPHGIGRIRSHPTYFKHSSS